MKIPDHLIGSFPEKRGRQCPHAKNICECGHVFDRALNKVDFQMSCPACGKPRQRCGNACMSNEDKCRKHAQGRAHSPYTQLVAQNAEVAFEELLERDGLSYDEEAMMAKIYLAQMLEGKKPDELPPTKDILEAIETVVRIGERVKKLQQGEHLQISINDESAAQIRKQVRKYIVAFKESMNEHNVDPATIVRVLRTVQEKTKLKGNSVTLPKQSVQQRVAIEVGKRSRSSNDGDL